MSRRPAPEDSPIPSSKVPKTTHRERDPFASVWFAMKRLHDIPSVENLLSLEELIKTRRIDLNSSNLIRRVFTALQCLEDINLPCGPRILKALLDAGGSTHKCHGMEEGILHMSLWHRPRPDIVAVLLEHGCDPNEVNYLGNSALHNAVRYGGSKVVRLILEYGGHANARNKEGSTPLHGNIPNFADFAVLNLHHARRPKGSSFSPEERVLTAFALLDYGADPNAVNNRNETPLTVAISEIVNTAPDPDIVNNLSVVAVLLYIGAIPRKEDLDLCARKSRGELIRHELECAMGIAHRAFDTRRDWTFQTEKLD
jgi:ankyrin repeat protein